MKRLMIRNHYRVYDQKLSRIISEVFWNRWARSVSASVLVFWSLMLSTSSTMKCGNVRRATKRREAHHLSEKSSSRLFRVRLLLSFSIMWKQVHVKQGNHRYAPAFQTQRLSMYIQLQKSCILQQHLTHTHTATVLYICLKKTEWFMKTLICLFITHVLPQRCWEQPYVWKHIYTDSASSRVFSTFFFSI